MVLKNVYVIPHGDELIDLPDTNSREMATSLAAIASHDSSDVLAIISPHNLRLERNISVIKTQYLRLNYRLKTGTIRGKYETDSNLADLITTRNPEITEGAYFITSSGSNSVFPMDFGTGIPLHFFRKRNIVSLGQARMGDRKVLMNFGRSLCHTLNNYSRSVSLIISADQAHTHSENGPYGYAPEARLYDETIIDAIKRSRLSSILSISENLITKGKPDSYWNMLILAGIIEECELQLNFDYYYVAEYFGMLLAHASI
ncbi:MAG: hypothetical protein AAE977_02055 [Thermoplasmataceae archaeon]